MTVVIVIDPTAAPGVRDIAIANSSPLNMIESFALAGAFTVLPPAVAATAPTATPTPGASGNAQATAARPQLDVISLDPPTDVTVRCRIIGGSPWVPTWTCAINWTQVTGASGYVVTRRVSVCREKEQRHRLLCYVGVGRVFAQSGRRICVLVYQDECSGDYGWFFLTAVFPGDAHSIEVAARRVQ